MDPVITQLDGWAEVVIWFQNLSAVFFGVDPNLRHLFVKLGDRLT